MNNNYQSAIKRAKEILSSIESEGSSGVVIKVKEKKAEDSSPQMDFSDAGALVLANELQKLDATTLTPIEAMNYLYQVVSDLQKNQ